MNSAMWIMNAPVVVLRSLSKWVSAHRAVTGITLVVLIAGLVFFNFRYKQSQGVLTEPIQRGTIVESVYGIGTVVANRSYQLKPAVTKTLMEIIVKEGDVVGKGAPLVRMDETLYRAPFRGTVTSLPFKVGENVFTSTPVLILVDLQDRYLVISLEQQGALRVKAGQEAKVSFDTIRQTTFNGIVKSVYSNDSNFLARIDISDLPANILPGMTADVAVTIRQDQNVLLAPVASLEHGHYIWVKRGRWPVSKTEVKVGIVDKAMAEILSGDLKEGDRALIRQKVTN